MLISAKGIIIRTGLDQLHDIGRNTQGVRLIRLDAGDKLVAVARVVKEENGDDKAEIEATDAPNEDSAPENSDSDDSAAAEGPLPPADGDGT